MLKFYKKISNAIIFIIFTLNSRIIFADNSKSFKYQIEVIVFKRLNYKDLMTNKEVFNDLPFKYNKNKHINFNSNLQIKFLAKELNILSNNKSDYKIILQAVTPTELFVLGKNKKFLIKSPSLDTNNLSKEESFIGTLIVTPIRNNTFNLAFDGSLGKFRLIKSGKTKAKEIYYFDHPAFGALIGLFNI